MKASGETVERNMRSPEEALVERVAQGEMPPPAAGNVEPLSEAEVQLLETWVQEGMNP